MDHIKPIVLIDSCSYVFYRVTASSSWYSRAHPDKLANTDNSEFLTHLERQCFSCLNKLCTVAGIRVPLSEMYLIRDCPRDEIWRLKLLPTYKAHRSSSTSTVGPLIKHLNTVLAPKFLKVLRIAEAEADDVIAVLVDLFSAMFPSRKILIIANDSDYDQLLTRDNIEIWNPVGGWSKRSIDPLASLNAKVEFGDRTDGIPPAGSSIAKMIRNRELIDFSYIPRKIQDRIISGIGLGQRIPTYYTPTTIQLGLCCINTVLRERNVFCSRTMTLATISSKGLPELQRRALANCRDLITMIQWNADNGIRFLRISSDLFPHKSNARAPSYDLDFAQPLLAEAGALARKYKQRLTFHPGQYNVVGTPNEDAFAQTIADLDWHAEVLDRMLCDRNSVMVVHGGGIYRDKEATIRRWIANFSRLPERVQRRLVLENCEKAFSIVDCLRVSKETNVPVVFDTHHFECYKLLHPTESFSPARDYLPDILDTWTNRGMRPKFHVSEQAPDGPIGKHSDYISRIPDYLLELTDIDIAIEAKMKEQAIFQLYRECPSLDPRPKIPKIMIKIGRPAVPRDPP